MTLQQLMARASAIRAELAELAALDEPTAEQLAQIGELRTEYASVETRSAAYHLSADADADTDDADADDAPEPHPLAGEASLGRIVQAVLEQRSIDGAERELQEEFGLNGNQVPLAMLETRAVTPAPSNVGRQQRPVIPYVFPDSVSAFLSVSQPTVPVGESVYPVLTTPAEPGTPAKGASQAETTGAFSATVLKPGRIQASFFYAREDRAIFAGMDAALRDNLRAALSDKLDSQVVAGLEAGGSKIDASGSVVDFAEAIKQTYSGVDGSYASTPASLRWVLGDDVYTILAGAYRGTGTNETALDSMMAKTGGVRLSAHIGATASKKQNALLRVGTRMDAVTPIWQGITLIPDEITKAATGEIVITAVMLYAFSVLRTTPIRVVNFQVA